MFAWLANSDARSPSQAASDKLIREMEMFGPDFEKYNPDEPVRQTP